MSHLKRSFVVLLTSCLASVSGYSSILLDDTWSDGTRNDQNLPTESAWFSSSGAALTAAPGSMTLAMGGSAIFAITYFTTNDTSPVQLEIGDTLTATLAVTLNGVPPVNSSQGFRLGLFNFADSSLAPKRVSVDGFSSSSQGTGVQGYALFQNMGATFNNSSPTDIRKRTTISDSSLLGTSGDWTSLVTGPGNTNSFSGFTAGVPYLLQLTLQRTNASSLSITVTWLNTANSSTLSTSFTDTGATNFSFDGIALRPQQASQASTNILFSEVKVEYTAGSTPPDIGLQPQDQTVFTNQDAFFSVVVGGTPPLSYQWYSNTNTLIPDATNATLTVNDAQLSDSGEYSVVITNFSGSVTSDFAHLTVNIPVAPSIITDPQDQFISLGGTAQFNVMAGGSEPLLYQWYFNTNAPIPNATDSTLTLTNVQLGDAGTYSVVVSNLAGSATSLNAVLTINTNPVAPTFTTEPASQIVLVGGTASFAATASGTAPIVFQWNKGGVPIPGALSSTLTISNAQSSDAGSYTVTASNSVGPVTSDAAILTVTPNVPVVNSAFNLTGFGNATTGGGIIADTDPAYRKVYTALDLANAILSANKTAGSVKVIEIMNDLDLGWNEVGTAVQTLGSTPFRAHATPKLHPRLLVTGVSLIDIKSKSGLTFFSANGATIRHACFNIKSTANIIVRNLKFDELWEWDESSKGKYDGNDWDFIDLGNAGTVSNIWIDHCTFTKAYDGIADIKQGSHHITFSWCKYTGDDGASNTNSWVRQQINKLEQSPSSYPMYNFLRTHGFSVEDIVLISQGHDKTHLIGANDLDSQNAQHSVTFHHDWFINPWDRLPRLRAGNVHNYNIYVDDIQGLAAKRLRDARKAAMIPSAQTTLENTYSFKPFLNGSISTEGGAVLVEKSVYIDCLTPLRNNQTDPSNPTYTGKIMALDTIYQMDSTVVRGNSTDPGNPLGPFQAAIIPFSWNLPGNQLPYTYTLDDPSQLQSIITSPTSGAGAGVLTWAKTNWLRTSYPATAPTIVADAQDQSVAPGQSATFTVFAGGSTPLYYQWYFNTNTPIANATNSSLTVTNAQSTNAGTYSVIVTNSAGPASSRYAVLTVNVPGGFAAWQSANFTSQQLTNPAISGLNATPAGDGVPNLVKYALGLPPFVPATQPLVTLQPPNSQGALVYHRPASVNDVIYQAETSTDLVNWSTTGVTQQNTGTDGNGLQIWQATYSGPGSDKRYFRLTLIH
jgi:pectate lyase